MADAPVLSPAEQTTALLAQVREVIRDKGTRGKNSLPIEIVVAATLMTKFALRDAGLSEVFERASLATCIKTIMLRFFEACRRNGIETLPDAVDGLAPRFLSELRENMKGLEFSNPDKLITLTYYQGDACAHMMREEEFAYFKDTPWIIKQAAAGYPRDPRGYLREVRDHATLLLSENEFAQFKDKEWIVRHAVINHYDKNNPDKSREYLRNVIKTAKEILTDKKFSLLKKTPGLVYKAILSWSNPREQLSRTMPLGRPDHVPYRAGDGRQIIRKHNAD